MIQFLSGVISMVVPTWCHGPTWGNSLKGGCRWTDLRICTFLSENSFTYCETVGLAVPHLLWHLAAPAVFANPRTLLILPKWSCREQPKTFGFATSRHTEDCICWLHTYLEASGKSSSFRWGFFGIWWGWKIVHPIRDNLNSRFMPFYMDRLLSLRGSNARPCI